MVLFLSSLLFCNSALATLDIRLGGGVGFGLGNNQGSIPQIDGGETQSFTTAGYNLDVILSDYWLVFGARAEEFQSGTDSFFYFDTNDNQYTKYGVKTKNRTYSGLIGFHFELNTPNDLPDGSKVLYSAGLFGVIPFSQTNDVSVESFNAANNFKVDGSAPKPKQWGVYVEGNRSAPGGFTAGIQMGFRYYKLENIADSSGTPLLDYQGNPLELDLSSIDFRVFLGIRF